MANIITLGTQQQQYITTHTATATFSGLGTGGNSKDVYVLFGMCIGDGTQHIYSVSQTNVSWSEVVSNTSPTAKAFAEIWVGVATGTPGADITVGLGDFGDVTSIQLVATRWDMGGGTYSLIGSEFDQYTSGYSATAGQNRTWAGNDCMVGCVSWDYQLQTFFGSNFTSLTVTSGVEPYFNAGYKLDIGTGAINQNYTSEIDTNPAESVALAFAFHSTPPATGNKGAYYM